MFQTKPIRIRFNNVCDLLDVSRESLRHIIRTDPTFPSPYKHGTSKQSPVFFDYQELEDWYKNRKQAPTEKVEA